MYMFVKKYFFQMLLKFDYYFLKKYKRRSSLCIIVCDGPFFLLGDYLKALAGLTGRPAEDERFDLRREVPERQQLPKHITCMSTSVIEAWKKGRGGKPGTDEYR
jgi:hypothetical protein